jgi:signal transduction histidine kinase/ActR/RegA family two-component response regulator
MITRNSTPPRLQMLRGEILSRLFELAGNSTVLGRDPDCNIVLGCKHVSRKHARIFRHRDGYFLEDLARVGGTQVNGQTSGGPVRLKDGDLIQVGDCLFRFSGSLVEIRDEDESRSAILGILDAAGATGRHLAGGRPETKLRALLEIGQGLAKAHDLDGVLGTILDALFRIFPQAGRGFVILKDGGAVDLTPRALKTRGDDPGDLIISRTIFDHVMGEGKAVLSLDVLSDRRFRTSRSAQAARLRTLMCVPLWDHERRPAGILQVDTQDVQARFGPEDLDLLVAVAGPVSVALDNARLLDEARREKRRLGLLAEAGALLAALFDHEEALSCLARLAVPQLADLCLIDLRAEDGSVKRVAAVHADPAEQPLVDDLRRRFPPEPEGLQPAMRVLRSGMPEVNNEVADQVYAAACRAPEHSAIVRRLGFKSYMIVPMIARGRTLGVLSLIGTRADRRHTPADLTLAEELARRAAMAVDNARLYREAQAASRAKDRFMAMLSHELRTPLTPILATVSARLERGGDPEIAAEMEMIRRNVALEARLIDDLLDVSRIERGQLRLNLEVVDVHEAIRKAVEICRDEVIGVGLELVLDLAATRHHVTGDPARMMQIVWNLVQNAVKFTPEGGTLTIRTANPRRAPSRTRDDLLVVEFEDTGLGIEPEVLPRIFDPFERGRAGLHGRPAGLGLGLAICRLLAEAHRGKLEAFSPGEGFGSTFRLELASVPAPALGAGGTPPPPALPPRRSLKILLVEDNRDTLHFLALVLGQRGHTVRKAASMAQAWEELTADLDLVISDIELPDGSGLDLMREMGDGVPGIAMSGFGSEEDVRLSREAGFATHLTKPIDIARLEAAIQQFGANADRTRPIAEASP